ncbi:MAG: hypothetical protein KAJ51_03865, partial [Thermoplasmata archaeon]|nr:hypothetical protein [Thermoplasmata archaeon]
MSFDWNSWSKIRAVSAKLNDNELELKAYIEDMNEFIDFNIHIFDGDGNQDFSDRVASNEKGSLVVSSESFGGSVIPKGASDQKALELTLKAEGTDLVIKSLTLELEGSADDNDISELKCYRDANNDFSFSYNADQKIAQQPSGFNNGKVVLELSPELEISAGKIELLFVTVDVASSAATSNTIGISITGIDISTGTVTGIDYFEGSKKFYIDSIPQDEIVIDGAFRDWETLQTIESYVDPKDGYNNVDLIEYKLNRDSEHLSLYFKVAGKLLEGTRVPASSVFFSTLPQPQDSDGDGVPDHMDPNPDESPPADTDGDRLYDDYETVIKGTSPNEVDSDGDTVDDFDDFYPLDPTKSTAPPPPWILGQDQAYIFLDTDHNPGTGYKVRDNTNQLKLGAEYMVEITGKHGYVLNSNYHTYSGNGWNWNWNSMGKQNVGKDSSRLETQLSLTELQIGEDQAYDVFFYVTDWNYDRIDYSDLINFVNQTNSSGRTGDGSQSRHYIDASGYAYGIIAPQLATTPTIDGSKGGSEWDDASYDFIDLTNDCWVYVKYDASYLYVLFDGWAPPSITDYCEIAFDINHSGGNLESTDYKFNIS